MFIKIPFESNIDFRTNLSEITKMSLEHDYNVNDGVVLGNFYISGEYRAHAVSVNTDTFEYTLPFEVELRDDIDPNTIEFNIEDFSYEIVDNNKLKVNIEYSLQAEELKKEERFQQVNESELESELAFIDDFLESEEDNHEEDDSKSTKEVEENVEFEKEKEIEIENKDELVKIEEENEIKVSIKKEEDENDEERISMEEEKTVMDTIKDSDDTFVTYHIHIVKENETIESISAMYSTNSSLINEYNNIESLSIGDKILIPKLDE